ncbi:RNA methyltransferase [Nodosilinea sp. LEGE 07088]|uniref:RNA methyltransferase n=1 Tax=Nodosilinea sp. LEGE 07088 TaxID=2777968 RepID=UPI00188046A3|nr:RNA methyltransferase [Nodosilinea sp. LEGE 07088]MBE9137347.1 RNA methyltransferase [Nodosilinea sp. LEGE 07088]
MPLWQLDQIRIVLVEPAGPLNVGATARVMKNMGLRQLVLVNPQCDLASAEAQRMAVHGGDVLAAATIAPTLPEALAGCERAIATTGRLHPQAQPLDRPEVALPWLLPPTPEHTFAAALVFGPEDRGLSNDELVYTQRWIRIPATDDYPSLNLAQAVAVCGYLLHRFALAEAGAEVGAALATPLAATHSKRELAHSAPLDQIEMFYGDLEVLLLKIGYLYPHTAPSRMAKLRQLLHRAEPDSQELAMLRGILRQINWAVESLHQD